MADRSRIEWTGATWNPVVGCERVSSGCAHCYAIREARRLADHPKSEIRRVYEGLVERRRNGQLDWTGIVRCLPERLDDPLRWQTPRLVFVNSMSDLFHDQVPDEFIAEVFAVMGAASRHVFQVLTKRPARMARLLNDPAFRADVFLRMDRLLREGKVRPRDVIRAAGPFLRGRWPLRNVWLGVSVENQAAADERIPHLVATPAAVRFLSCEPLLGPVKLPPEALGGYPESNWWVQHGPHEPRVHWVIVGGESGPGARPMHPDWVRSIRDQCKEAGIPVFVKQMGSVWAGEHGGPSKGSDPAYWPEDLRVREMPHATR